MPGGLAWADSLLALAAVVVLLLAAASLLARWRNRLVARGGGRLQVIETLVLDPRSRLVVVRWDGADLLVAVGPSTISLVAADRPPGPTA